MSWADARRPVPRLWIRSAEGGSVGPKGGGQKGHMPPPPPPEATTRHTLLPTPPEKKLIIELKNGTSASCSFYSNTYAITECKNGRAL